jgi:lysophospholipase L1-like esterase
LRPHFTVDWRLLAVNGLDSPGLVNLLQKAPADHFDVVVLSSGVNDVTNLLSPAQWLQWQDKLANVIQSRFEPQLLIHSAIPPMHGFTALPQPLRWFMGRWALEMNRRLDARLSGKTERILHWPFREAATEGLAADGFHPGPVGYDIWAKGLSRVILMHSAREYRPND